MAKVRINNDVSMYPMPVVLVGAMVGGRANFLTVAWVSRVHYDPPMIGIALGADHYTNPGIEESGAFSVNVPSVELVDKVDFCGLVSGREFAKDSLFELFYGEITGAPMVEECPLCLECRLVKKVELPGDVLYIGEVVASYAERRCVKRGRLNVREIKPFALTMPDNRYWTLGQPVAKAWQVGKRLKKK
ncbi:MAG: flavin reductase family protein [bacterium]|jgi:flavin reductase (DIM6/NTAB) family NADH-FMN oxidoreductase RutF|nr:flavin reductase family protein [candidate division KSB1 bacterium]MDH7560312.1 flavin reductase family protein [bacterium]